MHGLERGIYSGDMFKIVEMKDGSTKVYDSETGRVICSVPKKRDKPLGIGRPILRQVNSNEQQDGIRHVDRNTFNSHQLQTSIQCTVTPLQWESSYNQGLLTEKCNFKTEDDLLLDEEISEDCITHAEFMQTLQLCPKPAVQNGTWKKLKQGLPTRLISRIEPTDKVCSLDLKVCEDIELFSPLGKKWLNDPQDGQKKLIDDNTAVHSIKKYEAFCKINLNSSGSPYSMRCRETKKYVSTYKPLKTKHYTHVYCFNSKQRRERLKVLETGLTKRGRKLKLLCKKCTVNLKRISEEDIKKLTARKPPVIEIIDLVPCNEERKLPVQISPEILSRRNYSIYNCSVKLENICKQFVFTEFGTVLFKTRIKVGNLDDVFPSMNPFRNFRKNFRKKYPFCNMPLNIDKHSDHPYHRFKPQGRAAVFQVIDKNSFRNTFRRPQNATPKCITKVVKSSCGLDTRVSPSLKIIPVIELSSDEDEEASSNQSSLPPILSSNDVPMLHSPSPSRRTSDNDVILIGKQSFMEFFIFRCHACKHQSTYTVKQQATQAVKEHMFGYHKVVNLNMDLKVATDKSRNIFYIDVFNGYRM